MTKSELELDRELSAISVPLSRGELLGDLLIPPEAAGLVVFAHGSGSSRFSPRNRAVARRLNDRRIGTLLIDLLTAREEVIDEQTRALRFDVDFLAQRLLRVTDWVLGESSVGRLPIGYFGASTGAAAALIAAANRPGEIRAVVSRGGRPDLAGEALVRVEAPTLLLVGSEDREVLALNQEAGARMRCRWRLEIVAGATHLFEERGALERVAELAAEWFLRLESFLPSCLP